jgi:hypothetical protein
MDVNYSPPLFERIAAELYIRRVAALAPSQCIRHAARLSQEAILMADAFLQEFDAYCETGGTSAELAQATTDDVFALDRSQYNDGQWLVKQIRAQNIQIGDKFADSSLAAIISPKQHSIRVWSDADGAPSLKTFQPSDQLTVWRFQPSAA